MREFPIGAEEPVFRQALSKIATVSIRREGTIERGRILS